MRLLRTTIRHEKKGLSSKHNIIPDDRGLISLAFDTVQTRLFNVIMRTVTKQSWKNMRKSPGTMVLSELNFA